MNDAQAKALRDLSALLEKVALELVFAQPGSDNGLLPVNSLVGNMEEAAQAEGVSQLVVEGIAKGREMIDSTLLSVGEFTRESLDQLSAWVPWLQSTIAAVINGKTPPPFASASAAKTAETAIAPESSDLEEPLTLNLENDREFLREFVNESREHLENVEAGVLVLEERPKDADTLNSIFRAFHTFKGGSGFLNLAPMNRLAHELESLLDLARQNRIEIDSRVIEIILNGGDTLKRFVDAIDLQLTGQSPQAPILIPTGPLRKRIERAIAGPEARASKAIDDQTESVQRGVADASESDRPKANSTKATVKVDTVKLDMLIDTVGELVIAQSLVSQDSDIKTISSSRLTSNLALLGRTMKELQRTAMALRMVPMDATFRKMQRLVRDLAHRSGKEVELITQGEETELDRNIVETIHDPLVHMIRNSVDHGIEKAEERYTAGKPSTGRITLSAFHKAGNFVIEIKDDGRGLNQERIWQKAISLGIVRADEELTEKQIFNLIFAPGFSTAEQVTDISGRGVGMDVVRRNIEQIRGKFDIESQPGQGTTISILLPLTLAIIDCLIVRVGERNYLLPTLSVRESFRPTERMLSTVHGKGEIVSFRDRMLPLLRLNQFLNGNGEQTDPTKGVVVVVESDGEERCLLVDELIGKQEVVIKSLGAAFQFNPLLAGAAIMGDGRVGLILDIYALVHPKPISFSKAA